MPARFWATRSELNSIKKAVKKARSELDRLGVELISVRKDADEQWDLADALNAHNAIDNERVYEPESQIVTRAVLAAALDGVRCRCDDQCRRPSGDSDESLSEIDEKQQQGDAEETDSPNDRSSPETEPKPDNEGSHEPTQPNPNQAVRNKADIAISPSHSTYAGRRAARLTSPTHDGTSTSATPSPVTQSIAITPTRPRSKYRKRPSSAERLDFSRERWQSDVRDYHIRRYTGA